MSILKLRLFSVFKELAIRIQSDDISAWAAKLTFFLLLSIFPFLIFIMELLNHITIDTESVYELTQLFPQEIISIFTLIIEDISNVETSSSVLPIAIVAAIWSASKGIMAIIGGLNMAYKEKETRSYIYLRALSLIYTVAFAFILLITLGFIVFGNKIIGLLMINIPVLSEWTYTIDIIRLISSVILTFLFFILLYNATPNRKIMIRDVMPGAFFATISWIFVSYFFSIYVNTSKSFSYMYGSLTSIILLLVWLYVSSTIIMLGGEINAINSEHKKKRRAI
ncbi:MAG: ribonuclease [Firmicutes bacterium HGW-Firmicutes-1]|nr:MAG: ribonuclease [Firmicutes bacterium HGW-Firmicutes-1]